MTTCKDCYRRNPATGYCPVRTYEVEEDHEPCGSYATPPRDMNAPAEEATKVCKRCGRTLPLSSFSRNRNGLLGVCKDCMKAAQKKGAKPAKTAKTAKKETPAKPAEPEAPKEEPAHPELHESYDERIRKEILHYILYNAKGVSEEQEHSWIAYLERKKEQTSTEGDNETEIQKAFREGKSAGRKEVFDHPEEYGLQKAQKPVEWKPEPESLEALMYAIEGKWEMIKPTSYLSRRLEDLYEGLVNTFNVDESLVVELTKTAYSAKDIEEIKVLKRKIDESMEQKTVAHEDDFVSKPVEWSDKEVRFTLKDVIVRVLHDRGYQVDGSIFVTEKL